MKCGIDFSINSPGICIETDDDYLFFGGIRKNKKQTKKELIANSTLDYTLFYLPEKKESNLYNEQELLDLDDANETIEIILNIIKKFDIYNINIEGFSYNSLGSNTNKIYGYGYLLRNNLYKLNYNINIISPKTVKKTAGKGNFNKIQMGDAFLNNFLNDEKLNKNKFRNQIINNISNFKSGNNFLKPIEDIIDAYWVIKS